MRQKCRRMRRANTIKRTQLTAISPKVGTLDNFYANISGRNGPVPVVKDETPVEQPNNARNPDSDAALTRFIRVYQVFKVIS